MSVLQTVQKNNRQFTYGQTVQKKTTNNLHMDRQCKKMHWSIYSAPDSAKKKQQQQFTYGQTVQKKQQQFTYGQTVQKKQQQFTYGQTVQKTTDICYIYITYIYNIYITYILLYNNIYKHINMSVWLGTLDPHIISYLNLDIYLDMIKYIFIKVFALVISGHK